MGSVEGKYNHRGPGDQYNNPSTGTQNITNGDGPTYIAESIKFASPNAVDRAIPNLRVTNPQNDKTRIEHAKGGLHQDSCKWILAHPKFQEWRSSADSRLLWIKGHHGMGKTMLVVGVINELLSQPRASPESNDNSRPEILSYFFCERDDPRINNACAVLRGLVYLLAVQKPELIHHLRQSYEREGPDLFRDVNASIALSEILTKMLCDIKSAAVYLIVDAVNECEGLTSLLSYIENIASTCSHARWLVSSLNSKPDKVQGLLELELAPSIMSPAVNLYIDHKLRMLDPLKHNKTLQDTARARIREKANANFLWVSLACEELQGVDYARVQRVLAEAPDELLDMERRGRARMLLEHGYTQYMDFKKDPRKVVQRLEDAIKAYKKAYDAARSSRPQYDMGIIRAYISLAECHRELSHSRKLCPDAEAKMKQVNKADDYLQKAVLLAEKTEDKERLKRAKFDQAVLGARRALITMKQPGVVADAAVTRELEGTRDTLLMFRREYEIAGNKAAADWAKFWIGELDHAKLKAAQLRQT
ncbi:hypothetical protein DL764_005224 [Monosporascus ibericus]|uniref:NACHT domain-containing protein n=1 Tax=Monosporascus ibericus TaxID=155417 RepID=A0A4Q4TA17_9PEZI|nr:hypothetical protein DL764_005224 [Monosporascus ibericus]